MVRETLEAGPKNQSLLCAPLSLPGPANIVYQTFAFPSPGKLLSSPLKSHYHYPQHPLLSLAEGGI